MNASYILYQRKVKPQIERSKKRDQHRIMDIEIIFNEIEGYQDYQKTFGKLTKWTLSEIDLSVSKLSVIFSNDQHLRQLHRDFFNLDTNTDVITFNLNNEDEDIEGEIYLSVHQSEINSKKYNVPVYLELSRLIIHGCLHLAGYNDIHEDDKAVMKSKEDELVEMANNRFFK